MLRISFHIINTILIIFYLYPGSILGCVFYNDCNIQPNLTLVALISFSKELKKIIIYIIFISIFLEFTHLFIPNRAFEIPDLFGNIIGVIIITIIVYFFKKNENIKN